MTFKCFTHRYAFDVDASTQAFTNRRVFAYVDNGVPDGIQLDSNGNVYSGTGDGVQVSLIFFLVFFVYCHGSIGRISVPAFAGK